MFEKRSRFQKDHMFLFNKKLIWNSNRPFAKPCQDKFPKTDFYVEKHPLNTWSYFTTVSSLEQFLICHSKIPRSQQKAPRYRCQVWYISLYMRVQISSVCPYTCGLRWVLYFFTNHYLGSLWIFSSSSDPKRRQASRQARQQTSRQSTSQFQLSTKH